MWYICKSFIWILFVDSNLPSIHNRNSEPHIQHRNSLHTINSIIHLQQTWYCSYSNFTNILSSFPWCMSFFQNSFFINQCSTEIAFISYTLRNPMSNSPHVQPHVPPNPRQNNNPLHSKMDPSYSMESLPTHSLIEPSFCDKLIFTSFSHIQP